MLRWKAPALNDREDGGLRGSGHVHAGKSHQGAQNTTQTSVRVLPQSSDSESHHKLAFARAQTGYNMLLLSDPTNTNSSKPNVRSVRRVFAHPCSTTRTCCSNPEKDQTQKITKPKTLLTPQWSEVLKLCFCAGDDRHSCAPSEAKLCKGKPQRDQHVECVAYDVHSLYMIANT